MGDTSHLHEFLRTKARKKAGLEVDWEARKNDWVKNIRALHKRVQTWLKPVEKDGVSWKTKPTILTEEPLGSYEADILTIFIGNQKVVFDPKGTLLIGAEGRIDIRGQKAVRTIVFNDGRWSVVERAPRLKTLPFNEDSFQDILGEVME